jgi:hypothetical protein
MYTVVISVRINSFLKTDALIARACVCASVLFKVNPYFRRNLSTYFEIHARRQLIINNEIYDAWFVPCAPRRKRKTTHRFDTRENLGTYRPRLGSTDEIIRFPMHQQAFETKKKKIMCLRWFIFPFGHTGQFQFTASSRLFGRHRNLRKTKKSSFKSD